MTTSSEGSGWYHDAIIYEVHVRAFRDENGDGVGDFRGLTKKLDYLRDLGVTAIWLLPFYPSPLRDDGYDIADYKSINPAYGMMADFRKFLKEAHARDLKVITELVINHTSDQHPWFQRARNSPEGSSERDFYVWSDTTELYQDARIIFQDTEESNWTWDPIAKAYYWHRFFSHQPDLNFENPAVHDAVFDALDFWLDLGVDGLRLDAVPYLYEMDGTMCENLPETHQFLKRVRTRVDEQYEDRMLLAEANQWPEDAVAYFGDGDECHMAFHFPVMPRLFMALRSENRFPIIDILDQTPPIPENAAWAMFLRNHDELTLEMVTDEERDYMYRVFASDPRARINVGIRRRLAPLLGNDRREIELLTGLLLSLPGTPVLYYGDEIGMGDNVFLGDRNGVRTPMQWSGDRNAGFSEANPQSLYFPVVTDPEFHYTAVNVELQRGNPNSLWWWNKRALAARKSSPVLSRGDFQVVPSDNPKVLTFLRRLDTDHVLVVANLSRHPQPVSIDLSGFSGSVPVELFGRARFPEIGEGQYPMTVGPHDLYWFALEPGESVPVPRGRPRISVRGNKVAVYRARTQLQRALVSDIQTRRWFRSKARTIRDSDLIDIADVPGTEAKVAFLRLDYVQGEPELYAMPIDVLSGADAERFAEELPDAVIAEVHGLGDTALLVDAMFQDDLPRALLRMTTGRRRARGKAMTISAQRVPGSKEVAAVASDEPVSVLGLEQSNTSVVFGEKLIMKIFRKVESGVNPDVEIGRALTEWVDFEHTPAVRGVLHAELDGAISALAVVQEYIPAHTNAFDLTHDAAVRALESILASRSDLGAPPRLRHPLDVTESELERARDVFGPELVEASLLGVRTAELHLALGAIQEPAFKPEPMSTLQLRSLYQGIRTTVRGSIALLRRQRSRLRTEDLEAVERLMEAEARLLAQLRGITEEKIDCDRIRIHGDLHLGQVLHTGRDFVIIDFEGEPQRPLSQRRLKRLGLRDVAGMIRSYHYAMVMALQLVLESGLDDDARADLSGWAHAMHRWISASYLHGYLDTVEGSRIVPSGEKHIRRLLDGLIVEKAAYELEYELNNRPDWVEIPLQGILEIVD